MGSSARQPPPVTGAAVVRSTEDDMREPERSYTVGELIAALEHYGRHRRVVVSVNDYKEPLIVTGYASDLVIQQIDDEGHAMDGVVWILGLRNNPQRRR